MMCSNIRGNNDIYKGLSLHITIYRIFLIPRMCKLKKGWCIACNFYEIMCMFNKTHKLFQPMSSMNYLCLGKNKSLDHTMVSYAFEALRIVLK